MYGTYFKTLAGDIPQLTKFSVANNEYNAHLIFYSKIANLQNYAVSLASSSKSFDIGEVVVTCKPKAKEDLEQRYELDILHNKDFCHTFAIKKEKASS